MADWSKFICGGRWASLFRERMTDLAALTLQLQDRHDLAPGQLEEAAAALAATDETDATKAAFLTAQGQLLEVA